MQGYVIHFNDEKVIVALQVGLLMWVENIKS